MSWRQYIKLKSREPVCQWLGEYLFLKGSPLGTKFKTDLTPWLREPLEEFADNKNREITCQCCVQGGKTTVLHGAAVWSIANDCSSMFITCQTDDDSRDFAKERLNPSLDSLGVNVIELPTDRSKRAISYVSFINGFVLVQGANSNNLQSKSVRWILNDEVYLWEQGLLDEARKRGTRFWNRRILNCSTAGNSGEDLDRAYMAGDQRIWHLRCPSCDKLSQPKWERIKWDKSSCSNGEQWNYNLLKSLAKYECEHCRTQFENTAANHRAMNARGEYVPTNPNPSPQTISFQWNALCLAPTEVSWGELAVEWVKSDEEWRKGNEFPRKEFITKRLAETWSTEVVFEEFKLPVIPIEAWASELHRFVTVDVQEGHFWVLVQGWNANGDDYVHWADKLHTWEDIRAKQEEYAVRDSCVFVDCAFNTRQVFAACVNYGWCALRGEDIDNIQVTSKTGRKSSFYSWPPSQGDPYLGITTNKVRKYCPTMRWAKRSILDIAGNRRDGKARGIRCSVSPDVSLNFQKQMYSEMPKVERDRRGKEHRRWHRIGNRPNHLWDCYCMGIVAACMAGVIGGKD